MSHALSNLGFEVRSAYNPREAIVAGRLFAPELLVTDWMLGDSVCGGDILSQLRSVDPGLRSILITGYFDEAVERLAQRSFDEVLKKPFRTEQLIHAVRRVLAARQFSEDPDHWSEKAAC
jgi:DNA-binding NtrC family response regulator